MRWLLGETNTTYSPRSRHLKRGEIEATPALDPKRAQAIQRELEVTPFSGMVLVTPITPIPYFQKDLGGSLRRYADFINEELLPRVAQLAPISTEPERVGLSGVSMGGLVGLELMWRFPERFGAYCGIEIAINEHDAYRYAGLRSPSAAWATRASRAGSCPRPARGSQAEQEAAKAARYVAQLRALGIDGDGD